MLQSVEHICEVSVFSGPDAPASTPPDVFLELPHGATQLAHLQQAKTMARQYPSDEHDLFFLANTDQGSPEYATALGSWLTNPDAWDEAHKARVGRLKVLMVRALIPRTILDVNRVWLKEEEAVAAGMTRGVPDFITHPYDLKQLFVTFGRYHETVANAYALTCGHGGFAFQLHTYAPRSVNAVEGEYIVETIRKAYDPQLECPWPKRPEIQLITTPPEGPFLSNSFLCDHLEAGYTAMGLEVARDNPFNLHPATMAHTYAQQYTGQTLTLEISRALLAEPFDPFAEMKISLAKAKELAKPIAASFLAYHQQVFG